eukprot:TRINITY_DN7030_c0_g1_i1.p1 TRINITY_DN7030_c0_g1~~TRINITY_DN7030_c0_g1_i1.p1  ORF type:complete len:772 (-),score=249.29 TRINITY_DN7030_c0_g1_i1:38-2353(-)
MKRDESVHFANAVKAVPDKRVCDYIRTQRSVKEWIEQVLQIQGKLEDDLHVSLKSGVILCHLMLEIEDRSIPNIQTDQTKEFKLKENVLFFLEAIREYGVPRHRLFMTQDLWDNTGIVNVVSCLSTLADVAGKKGFPIKLEPIPEEGDYSDAAILKRLSKDQIKDLKTQLSRIKEPKLNASARPKVSAVILRKKMELLAGNNVDFQKVERGFCRFQAVFRGHRARLMVKKRRRDQAYRDNVAREILSTEDGYVKSIGMCVRFYYTPLKEALKKKPIIDQENLNNIFSDIEMILNLNTKLLTDLSPIVKNWSPRARLGKIFLNIADFLKIYSKYISNFNNSLETLEKCKKKPNFEKFLFDVFNDSKAETNSLDLSSFLIMPIQRVPRYNLLLKDLMKHTWAEHPDYDDLCKATAKIADIGQLLNEKKREAEDYSTLMRLQSSLHGSKAPRIAELNRKMLRHGEVEWQGKTYMCYIFNDIVLIAKPEPKLLKFGHSESYNYKQHFSLSEADVFKNEEGKVQVRRNGKPEVYTVKAPDAKSWETDFNAQVKKSTPSTPQTPSEKEHTHVASPDLNGAMEELNSRRRAQTSRTGAPRRASGAFSPVSQREDTKKEDLKKDSEAQTKLKKLEEERATIATHIQQLEEGNEHKDKKKDKTIIAQNKASITHLKEELKKLDDQIAELKSPSVTPSPSGSPKVMTPSSSGIGSPLSHSDPDRRPSVGSVGSEDTDEETVTSPGGTEIVKPRKKNATMRILGALTIRKKVRDSVREENNE